MIKYYYPKNITKLKYNEIYQQKYHPVSITQTISTKKEKKYINSILCKLIAYKYQKNITQFVLLKVYQQNI